MARRNTIVMTASSLACLFSCARKYYLNYVMGWRKRQTEAALRFGTAFHKGLEVWFGFISECNAKHTITENLVIQTASQKAITAALETAGDQPFDAETAAQLTALLCGYFARWKGVPFTVEPEREFAVRFPFLKCVVICGKMDGIVTTEDGRKMLIEHKTTSEDIGTLGDYWTTINRDQIGLYKAAADKDGIPILSVIYDVIRKPTIKCGKDETPEAYGERLAKDCVGAANGDNPRAKDYRRGADFYFARREIPLLDCDMDVLARRLYAAAVMIRAYRKLAKVFEAEGANALEAWPKCGSTMTCRTCSYRGVCHLSELPESDWEKGRMFEELTVAKKFL